MSNKVKLMFDMDSKPDFLVESLTESDSSGKKKYKIKGVFSTIGEKNRNGRTYPRQIWETEVRNYQATIESGSINTLMEYEHPARTEVNPMEAVAKITSLKTEGNYVIGEAVLLDNPKANQIKSLIDNDVKISVSSRGVGSVKNGLVESYKLITYDIVPVPSDYNSTMNGLVENHQLNEGIVSDLEFNINSLGEIIKESSTELTKELTKEDTEKYITEKFEKLLKDL